MSVPPLDACTVAATVGAPPPVVADPALVAAVALDVGALVGAAPLVVEALVGEVPPVAVVALGPFVAVGEAVLPPHAARSAAPADAAASAVNRRRESARSMNPRRVLVSSSTERIPCSSPCAVTRP